jgi:D-sedoheptulose 7-phosphate isomerase
MIGGMLEQRIQQQFFDSADLLNRVADTMARSVAEAAAALGAAITGGSKVLVCGGGQAAVLVSYFARLFTGRFERERPPLAALAIGVNPGSVAAQEVRALGLPGDVLLFIDDADADSTSVISAAQGKDMTIVVLAGRSASAFGELLAETDVLVAVPHERAARVAELQLLVLHCLCDAVDFQLMGDTES